MATIPPAKPRILVTRKLPDEVEARIEKDYDATLNETDELLADDDIIAGAQGCDGLLVTPTDKCNAALVARLPDTVKIIATFSVGYDHIDVDAATQRGISVTNTPDVLSAATADIAMLLLLGAARGAYWGERIVREDRWGAWSAVYPLGYEVSGKRLGILGMGRIGQAMARRARGFDMEIHYHNRSRLPSGEEQGAVFHETFEDMLPHCDFLSIHCASTPETRGIVDAQRIALMPDNAVLVNTARGDIVDDDALIAALQGGKLAAAGLDVFRNEPDIDPRYRSLDNAFLLPHLGSATIETRVAMGMRALDNLDAYFAGDNPGDLLNRI
ncbi:D-glycerate dehydrogenase [Kaustia mangrovi]|uniref:D-glycerate dehydrogenase n=1 Tax=Kaustia mangrovi TaxID=2593653 RepID=A0A7S8HAI8_9HYPH|nr:D-glycerate dehydrogenase [Kaustia mangrovi]QPC41625.1 D-glycerate dehydrogenase [Kaustia mangrovi]